MQKQLFESLDYTIELASKSKLGAIKVAVDGIKRAYDIMRSGDLARGVFERDRVWRAIPPSHAACRQLQHTIKRISRAMRINWFQERPALAVQYGWRIITPKGVGTVCKATPLKQGDMIALTIRDGDGNVWHEKRWKFNNIRFANSPEEEAARKEALSYLNKKSDDLR